MKKAEVTQRSQRTTEVSEAIETSRTRAHTNPPFSSNHFSREKSQKAQKGNIFFFAPFVTLCGQKQNHTLA
jgi:hypothetical protein